jgi:hypothetical protein
MESSGFATARGQLAGFAERVVKICQWGFFNRGVNCSLTRACVAVSKAPNSKKQSPPPVDLASGPGRLLVRPQGLLGRTSATLQPEVTIFRRALRFGDQHPFGNQAAATVFRRDTRFCAPALRPDCLCRG